MDLNNLLRSAVELGASDIHLKVGQPPILRRDGDLDPMEGFPALDGGRSDGDPPDVGGRAPEKLAHFDDAGDLDIAYQDEDLPRFRVNAYRQRGAISFAFRVIPKTRAELRAAQPAARRPEARRGAPRARTRHRRDGLGKDDDARGDDRLHESHPEAAHHHDRGPDRDPASRSRLHRQPARGRARHRVVRPGAAARAASGPRHDSDRRASRRRDRPDRTPGGRVGPPRAFDAAHDRRGGDGRHA